MEHLKSIINSLADFPSKAPNQMLLRHRQHLRASYKNSELEFVNV